MEVNAHAGAANRWLSRFAAGAAVALEETAGELRCPAWATGVPVRPEFFAVPELAESTLSAAPRLLVLGGSQGARALNRALPAAVAALRAQFSGLRVVHQSGALLLEETLAAYREAGSLDSVEVLPFLEDVAAEMGRAHLVVARAGAMTLAELQAAGRPSLLLPLAIAAGHQVDNARAQERAGAAAVLLATEATPERLATALADLLGDIQRLQTMARSAHALARAGAAAAIADRIEQVAAGEARP
jgi:UDP-N-acetylglucosamine--N-acetylmuramyl-(pentapeptide) pyrophosphoryl-undecaprenol N-acetylglucosamine transferase